MHSESLLYQPTWRMIDQSTLGPSFDALQSFAMDDTLSTSVGSGESMPTARTWVHDKTVVLGIQDTRLPFVNSGIAYLKENGYDVIVRNSGGLAVPLDQGVLNISLIFAENQKVSIDRGYEAMAAFVRRMLEPFGVKVDAKEIEHSYCPGRFDLSIAGQKFAGISQRRIRSGIAVQVYLCSKGSGAERARLLREFYNCSGARGDTKMRYPHIQPEMMASLSELIGQSLDVKAMMSLFVMALKHYSSEMTTATLDPHEIDLFYSYYKRGRDRNKKVLNKS